MKIKSVLSSDAGLDKTGWSTCEAEHEKYLQSFPAAQGFYAEIKYRAFLHHYRRWKIQITAEWQLCVDILS